MSDASAALPQGASDTGSNAGSDPGQSVGGLTPSLTPPLTSSPEPFRLPFPPGMNILLNISFLPPVIEAPTQAILTALSADDMAFEVGRLLMRNTHLEVAWAMPQKGMFRVVCKVASVHKLDVSKYQVTASFEQFAPPLSSWLKRMVKDFQECEERIKVRKGTVCMPDCQFMRYCTKPQRRDYEKGPLLEVVEPTPQVQAPAAVTEASSAQSAVPDRPARRKHVWVLSVFFAAIVSGFLLMVSLSNHVGLTSFDQLRMIKKPKKVAAQTPTPTATPEELERVVRWAKKYVFKAGGPMLEQAAVWKLRAYKQKEVLMAMREGKRSFLPSAVKWSAQDIQEGRFEVSLAFLSQDPAKGLVYRFRVLPERKIFQASSEAQAEFLDTIGTMPVYSETVRDALSYLGHAETLRRLQKTGANAKRLLRSKKLLQRSERVFKKTHGTKPLANLKVAYRL